MKINCIIVEDEPLARSLLRDYIQKLSFLNLLQECSNPIEAIEVLNSKKVDLLFLDIQMPEITGINFLKVLQNRPFVIFTTAYSQYAIEGYELDVVDYLLKPITFERFLKAVEKLQTRFKESQNNFFPQPINNPIPEPTFLFVKDGTKMVKVFIDDILYIEGLKDYVSIFTNQQKIVTLQRIKTLEAQLPANRFTRIHNSYIVSLKGIDAIFKEKVQIGGKFLPSTLR